MRTNGPPEVTMSSRPRSLGAAIRLRREQKDLTQRELGDLLGKRQTTISSWENGESRPRVTDLPRIAEALGLDAQRLLRLHMGFPEPDGAEPADTRIEVLIHLVDQLRAELETLRRRGPDGS